MKVLQRNHSKRLSMFFYRLQESKILKANKQQTV